MSDLITKRDDPRIAGIRESPRNMTRLTTLSGIKRERERTEARLYEMALALIESQARKILVAHSVLDEFVMAMGGWMFTRRDSQDDISTVYREYIPAYALPFTRMMDEFDHLELKVTGESMCFTAHGPVVREWGGTDGLGGEGVAVMYASPRLIEHASKEKR